MPLDDNLFVLLEQVFDQHLQRFSLIEVHVVALKNSVQELSTFWHVEDPVYSHGLDVDREGLEFV